ncbi:MAG: YqgE/AlgH family protein [Muribaculaceae bacterium]|nr:YqgE/AlgH family protein [Muribaculaceae bacterium]
MNNWDQDIYHLNDEQSQPKRGSLLVAKPTVGDFFFKRSLVLIVDPDEGEGAMGVVVNHYTGYNLRDILPDIETVEEIPLFLGGPVGDQMLFYIHTLGPEIIPESIDMGNGVWFGGHFDAIKRYVELGAPVGGHIKFIVGYSGWEKDQITSEINRHDWAVLDGAGRDLLMGDGDDNQWRDAVAHFGDRYRLWLNLPSDPSFN